MSALHLHATLAHLVDLHGSAAVLASLRDACVTAGDFSTTSGAEWEPVDQHWQRAGVAIGCALSDVELAERVGVTVLGDALCVLDDTGVT